MTVAADLSARLQELEEENAYLRRQLALEVDEQLVWAIKRELGVTPHEARILVALADEGRPLSDGALIDLLPTRSGGERENNNILRVYASKIRQKLGAHSILTEWGFGYDLSDDLRARVLALKAQKAKAA